MLRILAYNHNSPLSADHLTFGTNRFYRASDLHIDTDVAVSSLGTQYVPLSRRTVKTRLSHGPLSRCVYNASASVPKYGTIQHSCYSALPETSSWVGFQQPPHADGLRPLFFDCVRLLEPLRLYTPPRVRTSTPFFVNATVCSK